MRARYHPCNPSHLGGPHVGRMATSPLSSRGSPHGGKIGPGYRTLPSGGPQWKGTELEVATSPLPSRGPKNGRIGYVTRAFSGVPNKGDKIRIAYNTAAFSGGQKWVDCTGGVSLVQVRDPPPRPRSPLSYQGSMATGHTYGGAEGARKFFFTLCPRSTPPRPGGGAPRHYP